MKHLLLITFDIIRPEDPVITFSIASIIAALKENEHYKNKYDFNHISINLYDFEDINAENIFEKIRSKINICDYDYIALSAYIWAEQFINKLILIIKKTKYKGIIILGGNQIITDVNLQSLYPQCEIFILGYAEGSIIKAILNEYERYPVLIEYDSQSDEIYSPFIAGIYNESNKYRNIRTETKRGCKYKCSYCGHVDLLNKTVIEHPKERILADIKILKTINPERINIIDPVFTMGKYYNTYLDYITEIGLKSQIKIQIKTETISTNNNEILINQFRKINVLLEMGVQTIIQKEAKAVNRNTNRDNIISSIRILNDNNIPYEMSLIFGLPHQTYESFKESFEFLEANGCLNIKAFPLNLLRGTSLYKHKERFNLQEKNLGKYSLPYVVSSDSFNEKEWNLMNEYVQKKLNAYVI